MNSIEFSEAFLVLTGNPPFPWQRALYDRLSRGDFPDSCNLPTGLGKTNVIAIWLIGLLNYPNLIARRLIYIVNRRTVVDQTTTEVEKIRVNLQKLTSIPEDRRSLAISTLRGQFADNREWSADPSRPAVICGTVDMIGSRLLFSGYGVGYKVKPLHAGFLGQDTLLVHDEAHLEPAFQDLLLAIQAEQKRCGDFRKLRVIELTATSRGGAKSFPNEEEGAANEQDAVVQMRIGAKKAIMLHETSDEKKKLADMIVELALTHKDSQKAILVFVRKVDDVGKIVTKLEKENQQVQQLTGTLRGLERDRMADPRRPDGCPIFARFLPPPKLNAPEAERWKLDPKPGTVFLVCTSAGEVGVNISADHLVCDLTTFESMAQRFGRVNRFGTCPDTRIDIVHPAEFGDDDYAKARQLTLTLLKNLNGDGSPRALANLDEAERKVAFAPPPTILPVSDILFDAWALTTIRDKLPGRPPVEAYLHGIQDDKELDTQFAWRKEVAIMKLSEEATAVEIEEREDWLSDYLDEYPLKPHELLTERTNRALNALKELSATHVNVAAWKIDADETVHLTTIGGLVDGGSGPLIGRTVVLPPEVGGLTKRGMLRGQEPFSAEIKYDVADDFPNRTTRPRVRFIWTADAEEPWALIGAGPDFTDQPDDRGRLRNMRRLPPLPLSADDDRITKQFCAYLGPHVVQDGAETWSRQASKDQPLALHLADVEQCASAMVARLFPHDEPIKTAVALAARWHDLGKNRAVWQQSIGNRPPQPPLAKSANPMRFRELQGYRHEFGSLLDILDKNKGWYAELARHSDEIQDLVLHLIAAHHGFARPHFPVDNAFDPNYTEDTCQQLAVEVVQRFARLQRKYGRWGLAYLESLLRAADWHASANPSCEEKP